MKKTIKHKTYEQLNDKQRTIIDLICKRATEQEAAGEAIGIFAAEVASALKLETPTTRLALTPLVQGRFLSRRSTWGMIKTPFAAAGYKMQKLVVYSPGPAAPSQHEGSTNQRPPAS